MDSAQHVPRGSSRKMYLGSLPFRSQAREPHQGKMLEPRGNPYLGTSMEVHPWSLCGYSCTPLVEFSLNA
jgi:hypothetical protein